MVGPAVLGLAMLVVAALTLREVVQFRSGKHIITRPAYVLRLINSGVLLVVLGMLLCSMVFVSEWEPRRALGFWAAWIVLFVLFILLTINDLRMLRQVHHDRSEELRRRIMGESGDNGRQAPKGP